MRIRKVLYVLVPAVLLAACVTYAALPNTLNPATPANTDLVSAGAGQIRNFKQYLIDVFGLPNNVAVTSAAMSIATDGKITVPSAITLTTGVDNRLNATKGVFVTGETTPASGEGLFLSYFGNIGWIYSYTYTGAAYRPLTLLSSTFAIQTSTNFFTIDSGGSSMSSTAPISPARGTFDIQGNNAKPFTMSKSTAAVSAPSSGVGLLRWETGTNAGTLKLVAYSGTSTTGVTVVDNVGSGN